MGLGKFAYNRFVLVGPPEDPAGVSQASDVVEAFRRIAASPVAFFSRGDQSGTHDKERALWRAAGVTLASNYLIVVGNDMATTLSETDLRQGYTLSGEATFRQLQSRFDLVALLSEDGRLMNTYAVVYARSNPSAVRFAEWLVSGDGSQRLDDYRIGGTVAFRSWPQGCRADTPSAEPCS